MKKEFFIDGGSVVVDLNNSRELTMHPLAGSLRVLFLLPMLMTGFWLSLTDRAVAQTLKVLHSFTATTKDGTNPDGLTLAENTLYGTVLTGDGSGNFSIFKLNTDGTGYTNLHTFGGSDGTSPSSLVVSGSVLFGTARGGRFGNGTVFAVNTDGTSFKNLYHFTASSTNSLGEYTNIDGGSLSSLLVSSNTVYGSAGSGGTSGNGTIFKLCTDGSGFTTIHSFTTLNNGSNSDGVQPTSLVSSGNTLYGATGGGGISGNGTVFKVNTEGTGFTTLLDIGAGSLALSGNNLYGTDGLNVFKARTDGTDVKTLATVAWSPPRHSDGDSAWFGKLFLSGDTLHWTFNVYYSFPSRTLTSFLAVKTDGTGFTSRSEDLEGWEIVDLVWSGNAFYATTRVTLFGITSAPRLRMTPSASNTTLTWPTNYVGFDYSGYTLESTTDLGLPVWTTNVAAPAILNGQKTFSVPVTRKQQFFRLRQ